MPPESLSRVELLENYLAQLPYPPYPVQEEALYAWFDTDQGVLVCAPTGTGKTLIAHGALFEALHTGKVAYYTTPLIALTEQKFREMQEQAVRWGFSPDDVGLVTGNRRVNPRARILIVVAEILLNRLLHAGAGDDLGETFDFEHVSTVVMDEFHNFADLQRGIVWELALALLPTQVRLLLLSATVGNAPEFLSWLERCHNRKVQLVESKERKVPLTFRWVGDEFLGDQLVRMGKGEGEARTTPALVFCFNRDECWSVAEMLKGLDILSTGMKAPLNDAVDKLEWPEGVGPKLKQMLRRGVGVHHAGMLGKYRRAVEELFTRKLLAVCVCTETLAAGINLPARSVVLTTLVKGPRGKEKLVDASTAHQIFGRAGRPQFDDKGYVFAIAHEDDVRLLRWQEKFDQIPENTKDPNLLKAKKALKKKKPKKSDTVTYWTEPQFRQLQAAPPGKLYSKGPLPWRLLAYWLKLSPEVSKVRTVIRKRLMDETRIRAGEKQLDRMLLTLMRRGYVTLEPPAPEELEKDETGTTKIPDDYAVVRAVATPALDTLLVFRSIHPLYGAYLLDYLGVADRDERMQALESVLEIPRPLLRYVRVPWPDKLPPGPLGASINDELIARGLKIVEPPRSEEEEEEQEGWQPRPPTLADELRLLFDATCPDVQDVTTLAVWSAGELLRDYGGNFNLYIRGRDLVKQEGIIFRHLLRLILLCGEFAQVTPKGMSPEDWQAELREISERLTASCRAVDPTSTDQMIQQAAAVADVVKGEETAVVAEVKVEEPAEGFGAGDLGVTGEPTCLAPRLADTMSSADDGGGRVMSAMLAVEEDTLTLSELIERLGGIPVERIRFRRPLGSATEAEYIRFAEKTGRGCELIDGVIVEKAMGYYESRLAAVLIGALHPFLVKNPIGFVLAPDGMVRIEGSVRMPDVAFYPWSAFPTRRLPRAAILAATPTLAVEVISPSNTEAEMGRKRRDCYQAGTLLFWQVYPDERRVRAFTSVDEFTDLTDDETRLDASPAVPGFTLSVRQWFDEAGEREPA